MLRRSLQDKVALSWYVLVAAMQRQALVLLKGVLSQEGSMWLGVPGMLGTVCRKGETWVSIVSEG